MRTFFLSLILLPLGLFGQGAPMPVPKMQFFDNNGLPLSGGLLYTCTAGTTCPGNPQATYTDSTLGVPNANPVVLDTAGRANVWLSGTAAYKFVLQTSAGVTLYTVDGVPGPGVTSVTIPSGASLTMQSGSTASISTNFLPGADNTYTMGSSGSRWSTGYFYSLALNGNVAMGTDNAFDLGTRTSTFRNLWASTGVFSPADNTCYSTGGTGGLTTNCWNFTMPTTTTFRLNDNNSQIPLQWSYTGLNSYTLGLRGSVYPLDTTSPDGDLGTAGFPWNNLRLSQNVILLPGSHINTTTGTASDTSGKITASGGSVSHAFSTAYSNPPACVITPITDPSTETYWVTTNAGSFTIQTSTSTSLTFFYACYGNPN